MSEPKDKSPAPGVEKSSETEETGQGAEKQTALQAAITNPALIKAVQDKLGGLVGVSSGYIESLPDSVKRRLKALKNLQVESLKVEAKFYEEVQALEVKFSSKYREIAEKIGNIINGKYEPTDEECKWDLDDEEDEEEEGQRDEENFPKPFPEDCKGVPEFWLTAMKNVEHLQDKIMEYDEPVLKHLTDIELEHTETPGFILKFHFEPNQYFTDTVLTKAYEVKIEVNSDDPFSFDGPEVVKSTGCKINWNKGKNITVKTVKKKQKHKGHGQGRIVTKQMKVDSFFNFFSPPEALSEDEEDQERYAEVASDFELGLFFRDRFVPKAVLFFTGDAIEDDEEYEGDMEDDDEDLDEDEGEEGDPDFKPSKNTDPGKPQECKQQ